MDAIKKIDGIESLLGLEQPTLPTILAHGKPLLLIHLFQSWFLNFQLLLVML